MKKEENKKQEELNDEQLDNVAGAGRREDVIKEIKEFKERAKDVS